MKEHRQESSGQAANDKADTDVQRLFRHEGPWVWNCSVNDINPKVRLFWRIAAGCCARLELLLPMPLVGVRNGVRQFGSFIGPFAVGANFHDSRVSNYAKINPAFEQAEAFRCPERTIAGVIPVAPNAVQIQVVDNVA